MERMHVVFHSLPDPLRHCYMDDNEVESGARTECRQRREYCRLVMRPVDIMNNHYLRHWSRLIFVALIPALLVCSAHAASLACPGGKPLFDALLYGDKPADKITGLAEIGVVYEGTFWPPGSDRNSIPSAEAVKAAPLPRTKVIAIDVERFSLTGNDEVVKSNVNKLLLLLDRVRLARPEAQIGFYGAIPVRDYWRAIGKGSAKFRDWQAENDRLAELGRHIDVAFPSLYTFYPSVEGWEAYASAQIAEARRIAPGKRVIPFLWPAFHDSNRSLAGTELPENLWRAELALVFRSADGAVLWGGYGQRWNADSTWWRVVRNICNTR
jgi:hypothetical protein